MRENFIFQCTECGKKYNTSGPWEFYRNKKGKRLPYGNPGPVNEEARLRGVEGLFANMLCLDCGKEVEVIVEEYYRQPVRSKGFKAVAEFFRIRKKENDDQIKCPNCKGTNLFLGDKVKIGEDGKTEVECPSCHKGKLILKDRWIP